MKDALGSVQSVLVLGGNSEIAVETVKKLVRRRTRRVVLAGRDVEKLNERAAEIESCGTVDVESVDFDALDFGSHADFVEQRFAGNDGFDLVLLAFGVLGDQDNDVTDNVATAKVIGANFTGAASVLLPVARHMKEQGRGTICVLSTVAGERARANNFIYGSSKAGLDSFCQGLNDSLVGSGVDVVVVRPGFVKTKMTAHLEDKPMSTTPAAVADDIIAGIAKGAHTVWSPAKLRYVFAVMRHLPRPVWRMIKQ